MVHTNLEFETSNLILDLEFDQHLESHKHVINIIMGFRDMGCYSSEESNGSWGGGTMRGMRDAFIVPVVLFCPRSTGFHLSCWCIACMSTSMEPYDNSDN
jgi:hypothetical protein